MDSDGEWKKRDGYKNEISGAYVPPGNREGESGFSRMEHMLASSMEVSTQSSKQIVYPPFQIVVDELKELKYLDDENLGKAEE